MRSILLALTAGVLAACSSSVSAPSGDENAATPIVDYVQDRFIIHESSLDHGGTLSALLEALDRRDLDVFAVIDHAAGAASVNMELEPSTLVIFGNPRGGTPLFQSDPLMGAELPIRALVYVENGKVFLAVTGFGYLGRSYDLDDKAALVDRLTEIVNQIAAEATS